MAKPQPLLADPTMSTVPVPFGMAGGGGRPMGMQGSGGADYSFMGGHPEAFDYERAMERFGASSQGGPLLGGYDANFAMNAAFGGGMNQGAPDCVLMVYGINTQKMNCQRLFNLFCLYGNVLRVRFLKSKEGSAMVQMSDREGCERVIRMVSNTKLYGNKIQLSFSKQTYLQDIGNPHQLPDGSLAYQNYTGSKNNRYNGPDAANKNRAQPPSAVQYFFNAPPNVQESVLLMAFAEANVNGPEKVTLFPPKSEKSSRGLLHFTDAESSTEALVCANNSKLPNPNGKAPYVLKLCFSNASKDF